MGEWKSGAKRDLECGGPVKRSLRRGVADATGGSAGEVVGRTLRCEGCGTRKGED